MNTSDIHSGKARSRSGEPAGVRKNSTPGLRLHPALFPKRQSRAEEIDAGGAGGNRRRSGGAQGQPVSSWGRTTCGSNMLRDYESPYTATAAQRLIDAGLSSSANQSRRIRHGCRPNILLRPDVQSRDLSRVPGGSSGGARGGRGRHCAYCPRLRYRRLGSSTGFVCGIVGVKPTYGRVSRWAGRVRQQPSTRSAPRPATSATRHRRSGSSAGTIRSTPTSSLREVPDFSRDLDAPVQGLRLAIPAQAVIRRITRRFRGYSLRRSRSTSSSAQRSSMSICRSSITASRRTHIGSRRGFEQPCPSRRYPVYPSRPAGPGEDLFELLLQVAFEGFGPEVQPHHAGHARAEQRVALTRITTPALKVRRRIRMISTRVFFRLPRGAHMPASPSPA